ncbi:unnamed protein product [Oikopleura dioica]|uniref:Uncharacterized protein n=1 Tax=Oikopleura dioica TaxID=34765 RepID=E4XRD8_OIKDI|nr:unnamed protein product [Oikopleura dioica]
MSPPEKRARASPAQESSAEERNALFQRGLLNMMQLHPQVREISQDVLAKKSDAEITKEDLERIFDKIEKLESSTLSSGVSIGQTELMRELECMSDENQRLWRSLTKLEEEVKSCARVDSSTSENNSPGALANAINQFQKQIGTPDLTGEVEIRLKKIERELSEKTDRGSDRLWRHLSNLEEQITRRHGENDERLSKLEAIPSEISKDTDADPQSENNSVSITTEVNEKNSQLWKEIASLKSKMSEIIGRDLLDLKKKLNTSAQRADVRRIILDIENLKVEALSPMENKIKKLEAEISDLPKVNPSDLTSKKVPIGAPKVSVISDSNREEWERTLITKDDMKEFEEKLNKFILTAVSGFTKICRRVLDLSLHIKKLKRFLRLAGLLFQIIQKNQSLLLIGGVDWGNDGADQSGIWQLKDENWNQIGELLQADYWGSAIYIGRSIYYFGYHSGAIERLDFNEAEELQSVSKIGNNPGPYWKPDNFYLPALFQTVSNYCI